MRLTYEVYDVFTGSPLQGNPLAVFEDGQGVDDATMLAIAKELNLSETVFILPSTREDCVARFRIFTPAREMRFAGHPTIGSAYAIWRRGLTGTSARAFHVDELVGPVAVNVAEGDDPIVWLTTPTITEGDRVPLDAAAAAFGLQPDDLVPGVDPQIVGAGNPCLFVAARDSQTVDRAMADTAAMRIVDPQGDLCFFIFAPTEQGAYSRMFAPELGVAEDPATGSATGPLARYMMNNGLTPAHDGARLTSEQGTKMGRRSILHIRIRGEAGGEGIDVGGQVRHIVSATMYV